VGEEIISSLMDLVNEMEDPLYESIILRVEEDSSDFLVNVASATNSDSVLTIEENSSIAYYEVDIESKKLTIDPLVES